MSNRDSVDLDRSPDKNFRCPTHNRRRVSVGTPAGRGRREARPSGPPTLSFHRQEALPSLSLMVVHHPPRREDLVWDLVNWLRRGVKPQSHHVHTSCTSLLETSLVFLGGGDLSVPCPYRRRLRTNKKIRHIQSMYIIEIVDSTTPRDTLG